MMTPITKSTHTSTSSLDSKHEAHKIVLKDNTWVPTPPERTSSTRVLRSSSSGSRWMVTPLEPENSRGGRIVNGNERKESSGSQDGGVSLLKKALARRKYRKWSRDTSELSEAAKAGGGGQTGITDVEGNVMNSRREIPPSPSINTTHEGAVGGPGAVDPKKERKEGLEMRDADRVTLSIKDEEEAKKKKELKKLGVRVTNSSLSNSSEEQLRPTMSQPTYPEALEEDPDFSFDRNGIPRGQTWVGVRLKKHERIQDAEIDVLYENQRGLFLCGFPLFSSKSLLNFDPSPWQTKDFKPSACSVLDKQPPDPSWEWIWKTWYVDMTPDVDDQGWQYSFAFSPTFSGYGNHVWFHSFVRRRRWLRKRIRYPVKDDRSPGEIEAAHYMNSDYFTIHSRAKRKGDSIAAGSEQGWSWTAMRKSESVGGAGWGQANEGFLGVGEIDEIEDVPTLMKVLRKCRLDREKLWALQKFVEQGGDEVAYLAERMHSIMTLLIFQASRRQLIALMIEALAAAERNFEHDYSQSEARLSENSPLSDFPPTDNSSSAQSTTLTSTGLPLTKSSTPEPATTRSPAEPPKLDGMLPSPPFMDGSAEDTATPSKTKELRRVEALRKALEAAEEEVGKLEFWSDLKHAESHEESDGTETGRGKNFTGLDTNEAEDVRKSPGPDTAGDSRYKKGKGDETDSDSSSKPRVLDKGKKRAQ